jgi:hypothetical protein
MEEKKSKTPAKKATNPGRKRKKAEGLGDTIEQITTATGIKKAVHWFSEQTGIDCGCDARKEKLNKMFRYRKTDCMTQGEYEFFAEFRKRRTNSLAFADQEVLLKMYNRIFNTNEPHSSCGSCWKERINHLDAVFSTYEGE